MKIIEISSKKTKAGEKHFKAVLFKIHPDTCVVDKTGNEYNLNGITWLQEYAEKNKDTGVGSSVTVEFTDEERTEILGHGDTGVEDGIPVFENATVIGHFEKIYIETMVIDDEECLACVGEGVFDYMRYKKFLDILEERLTNGETIFGSVEIMGTVDNDNKISYLDGWKEKGRIPTDYVISGWAILDILPSDSNSRLLELNQNQNKEELKLTEQEIKDCIIKTITETNTAKSDTETKISELNEQIVAKDSTIEELNASIADMQKLLDEMKTEQETSWAERDILEKEIAKAKIAEKLAELDTAIGEFNEAEKEVAKEDIDKLKEEISSCEKKEELESKTTEINSIKSKICMAIVEKQKKAEADAKIAEINAAKEHENKADDIFGDVVEVNNANSEFDLLA